MAEPSPEQMLANCKRLLEVDHIDHEEIVRTLQLSQDPVAVPYLRAAILLKPRLKHLDYDDYGAFYKKCLWALRAIETPEAVAVIREFSESHDPVLQAQARYRLARLGAEP